MRIIKLSMLVLCLTLLTKNSSLSEEIVKESWKETIELTGDWQILPTHKIAFPPEGTWAEIKIDEPWHTTYKFHWKFFKEEWRGIPCAWYKKKVVIPNDWSGRRIKIKFWAVAHNSYVYLNGNKVGENHEGFCPFEVDITNVAKLGVENELLLGVEGGTSSPIKNPISPWYSGIWQKVELVTQSKVYIKDVFVKPSVRKKSLGLEITISNEDETSRSVTLYNSVENDISFTEQEIVMNPGEEKKIELETRWENPTYWLPDNPHLYFLITKIKDKDKVIDELKTRFGFREFWSEGQNLYLNGIKIRLKNRWLYQSNLEHEVSKFDNQLSKEAFILGLKDIKKCGYNSIRTHAVPFPPIVYESTDEAGMLIIAENALWQFPHPNSTKEQIEGCLEHTKRFVLANRNHPSIIMWSGGNEQGPVDEFFNRQIDLILSVDSTRLIQHSGAGLDQEAFFKASGKMMLYNVHYVENVLQPHWGVFPDIPNRFYWPIDENIWAGPNNWRNGRAKETDEPIVWKKDKPLLIGEHLGGGTSEWLAVIEGDKIYQESQCDEHNMWEDWDNPNSIKHRALMNMYNLILEAYRYCNVAMFSPMLHSARSAKCLSENFTAKEYAKELLHDFGLYVKEYDHNFYENEPIDRTVVIFNDSLKGKDVTFFWKLTLDKQILSSKDEKLRLNPGEVQTYPLRFKTPIVKERKKTELTLSLLEGDMLLYSKIYSYDIFPKKKIGLLLKGKIGLFDPLGKTENILRNEGIQFQKIKDLGEIKNNSFALVVFGYNSINKLTMPVEKVANILDQFVNKGGNVLVLEQDSLPKIFPISLKTSTKEIKARWVKEDDLGLATICFLRAKSHPILKGLEEDDLKFWRDDNIVVRNNLNKPERGNFIILADSGFLEYGLSRTPLLEMPYGKGTYIISQLEINSKYDKEPVASLILSNMINYGLSARYKENKVGLFIPKDSFLYNVLMYDLGVVGKEAEIDNLKDYDILIVYGETLKKLNIVKIREFVETGGKVLIHGITPQIKEEIENLLKSKVLIEPAKVGPVLFKDNPLTLGLASYNLYWLTKFESADAGQRFIEKGFNYKVKVENGQSLSEPEGIVKVNSGKGFYLINQFLFEDVKDDNRLKAFNYASILFTNLGIPLEKGSTLSLRLPSEGSKIPISHKPVNGPYKVDPHGFIRDWLKIGPFPNRGEGQDWRKGWEGKIGFEGWQKDYLTEHKSELMIEPQEGMKHKVLFPLFPLYSSWNEGEVTLEWEKHSSLMPKVDLLDLTLKEINLTNPQYVVGYAGCYIYSSQTRSVFLSFGSDDGYKIWLNHELIDENPAHRASSPDQDLFPVILKQGYNLLLLKIDQSIGGWEFFVRFLDREKEPLVDLNIWF